MIVKGHEYTVQNRPLAKVVIASSSGLPGSVQKTVSFP